MEEKHFFLLLLLGCSARDVRSGVQQGSVLGSVLCLIYENFIASDIKCSWIAFADDFKLCICYPRGKNDPLHGQAML